MTRQLSNSMRCYGGLRRQTAFTLLELVIALSLGSILTLLAVTLVHKAIDLRETTISRVTLTSKLDQIAREFRSAARRSTEAQITDDGTRIVLTNENGKSEFKFSDSKLQQVAIASDGKSRVVQEVELATNQHGFTRNCEFSKEGNLTALLVRKVAIAADLAPASSKIAPLLERRVVAMLGKWPASTDQSQSSEVEKRDDATGESEVDENNFEMPSDVEVEADLSDA